jgi:hypothetical protein
MYRYRAVPKVVSLSCFLVTVTDLLLALFPGALSHLSLHLRDYK